MTLQPLSSALYYAHSGRYSLPGTLLALLTVSLAAIVLGAAYAYIDFYMAIASLRFLLTAGTALALGAIAGNLLKFAKVRNIRIALFVTILAAIVMYLAIWLFWIYAFLRRANIDVTPLDLLKAPAQTWNALLQINEIGAWSIRGTTPTGIALWFIWAVEAALLLAIPLWLARTIINAAPFCEACGKWGKSRELLRLQCPEPDALRKTMEAKNFAPIASLQKAPFDSRCFYILYLQGCSSCDTTQTLCLDEVNITVNKKGQKSTKRKTIINRLLLTPEETVAVATAVAQLNFPVQSPTNPPAPSS